MNTAYTLGSDDNVAQTEPILTHWVDAKERVPEKHELALLHAKDTSTLYIGMWHYEAKKTGGWYLNGEMGAEHEIHGITHWMRIPSPLEIIISDAETVTKFDEVIANDDGIIPFRPRK